MSAPKARTSSGVTPFTAAWVPTGMKAGVRTAPCGVVISPRRAAPSVLLSWNEKEGDIGVARRHSRDASRQEAAVLTLLLNRGQPALGSDPKIDAAESRVQSPD